MTVSVVGEEEPRPPRILAVKFPVPLIVLINSDPCSLHLVSHITVSVAVITPFSDHLLMQSPEITNHILCGHLLPVSLAPRDQAPFIEPSRVAPVVLFTIQGLVGGHVLFHGGDVVSLLPLQGGGIKFQARVFPGSPGSPKVAYLFPHHLGDNGVTLRLCACVRSVTELAAAWPSTGHHTFLLLAPVHPHR